MTKPGVLYNVGYMTYGHTTVSDRFHDDFYFVISSLMSKFSCAAGWGQGSIRLTKGTTNETLVAFSSIDYFLATMGEYHWKEEITEAFA